LKYYEVPYLENERDRHIRDRDVIDDLTSVAKLEIIIDATQVAKAPSIIGLSSCG